MKIEDIVYRTVEGPAAAWPPVRSPSSAKALIVEVHGGAWTMNDRTHQRRHPPASRSERLSRSSRSTSAWRPRIRFPAALEDIDEGIRWARNNLNPARLGGLGTSSGGYLIVLCALRADAQTKLDFVIGCWPILDPLARYRMAKAKGLKNLVDAHDAFFRDAAQMTRRIRSSSLERAEPVRLAADAGAAGHGRRERRAPPRGCIRQRYRAAGGDIELQKFEGQPHTFIPKDPASAASQRALSRMVAFLQKERAHG